MEYFRYFPTFAYDNSTVTNILVRARIREKILSNELAYFNYRVSDQDKPEIIADKYYGHTRYTWIILYANNIVDPQFDWPLSYRDFLNYLYKKYQQNSEQDYETIARLQSTIHHYENAKEQIVLQADMGVGGKTVSYYDWEEQINENKRDIKVIDRKYLNQIVSELEEIFR